MDKKRKRELGWKFWKIRTKEEALYIIKQTAIAFYVLAALQSILFFIVGSAAFIDVAIIAVLATLLVLLKSRIVAVLLLIISVILVATTLLSIFGWVPGGKNILVALLATYIAFAGVFSTIKYHRYKSMGAGQNFSTLHR